MAKNDAERAALFLQLGWYDSAAFRANRSLSVIGLYDKPVPGEPQFQTVRNFIILHETEARENGVLSVCQTYRNQPDSSLALFRLAIYNAEVAGSIPVKAELFLQRFLSLRGEREGNPAICADSAMFWAGRLLDPWLEKSYADSISRCFAEMGQPVLQKKYAVISELLADTIARMKTTGGLAEHELLLSSVAVAQAMQFLNRIQDKNDKVIKRQNGIILVFLVFIGLIIFSLHIYSFKKSGPKRQAWPWPMPVRCFIRPSLRPIRARCSTRKNLSGSLSGLKS